MDVCIKNVDDSAWRTFKAESARNGIKTGEFFTKIVKEHESKCMGNAYRILNGKKPLKNILKTIDYNKIREGFRKDFKMRVPE